jgi:hypothetical protein
VKRRGYRGRNHVLSPRRSLSAAARTFIGGSNNPVTRKLDTATATFSTIGVTTISISNVRFAYGNNPDGSTAASLALFGAGLTGLALLRRRVRAR